MRVKVWSLEDWQRVERELKSCEQEWSRGFTT